MKIIANNKTKEQSILTIDELIEVCYDFYPPETKNKDKSFEIECSWVEHQRINKQVDDEIRSEFKALMNGLNYQEVFLPHLGLLKIRR